MGSLLQQRFLILACHCSFGSLIVGETHAHVINARRERREERGERREERGEKREERGDRRDESLKVRLKGIPTLTTSP